MTGPVISIENLSKRYTIGHQRASGDGMRHAIEGALRAPLAWLRSTRQKMLQRVDFWALKNVSLEIKQAEVVGIVGRNGAGKSTLLKILSRLTAPTDGRIRIHGRTASLRGWYRIFIRRENIFLNGAILGMTEPRSYASLTKLWSSPESKNFSIPR
jgi:lipopolysaccharide transport system ATP-binding protein